MTALPRRSAVAALPVLVLGQWLIAPVAALGQDVSGTAFEDRNGNGIRDPGEPPLPGVAVRLAGTQDGGAAFDLSAATDVGGLFSFAPGNGCYLVQPEDPAGWRLSAGRFDGFPQSTPGYLAPVGQPRFGRMTQGLAHLQSGSLQLAALGDSIAYNFNLCGTPGSFWYSKQIRSRLACVAPAASVTLSEAAVPGEHTDDLLVDDHDNLNNVFRVIEAQPDFITLSMIGNDLRGVEPPANPTPAEVDRAVAEILDSRQNLQEILSALVSEVPGADIALNSLYDQLSYKCSSLGTSPFHRTWLPIVNRILRDLAWGQARRVSINEVGAEFAHEDQREACSGFEGKICRDALLLDTIHPNNAGYSVIREKVWEAAGGVNLGPKDSLARTSIGNADYGFLRRVRRLLPTRAESRGGAAVVDAAASWSDTDGGAATQITLGAGSEEFRLSGFPDWYDEVQIVHVLAGVRYRTAGSVGDDMYRMEASVTGEFRPSPGFHYSATNWNFYTPIVGGGGPNQPVENPDYPIEKLLVVPNVAAFREASAMLTRNPVLPPGAADYEWPEPSAADLATTTIRVAAAPVAATAGNDDYAIELDAAWLDLYGWEKPRPPEISGLAGAGNGEELTVERQVDGSLLVTFSPIPGAQRYNLYFGRLDTLRAGTYDHGAAAPAGPHCGAPTQGAGAGRISIVVPPEDQPGVDAYVLVTAHVEDVESPAGFRSDDTEIDRSQSICR